jgi:molybdopterin-guanine dinucleotide biosynthesis protein B
LNTLSNPPIVSIVGSSGTGKTTLIEKLIPELTKRGYRVGTIKHNVHAFEIDQPGKDSWRHKKAGASGTVISSPNRIGLVMDVAYDYDPEELATLLTGMDIILTEGYKSHNMPKLEVFRGDCQKTEPLCKDDDRLLALICDSPAEFGVPRFSTDDIQELADFLISHFRLVPAVPLGQRQAV